MSWMAEAAAAELESRGARAELAARANAVLRAAGDYEIAYEDGLWQHRAGALWIPDGPVFAYADQCWLHWSEREAKFLRDASDYWFYL